MFPPFLPPDVQFLREFSSIALARRIKRQLIAAPDQQTVATAYVRQGTGMPVLLLHGFDSSVLEFRSLLPLLAAHSETWAVDMLGFGFTERLQGLAFAPPAIKTHLYSFWKTLINQPVMLVGASMGGATAIDFTLTYPDAVKQLVDETLGIGDAVKFHRAIAHSRLIWLKGCGHVPHLEQPQMTSQHLLAFLHDSYGHLSHLPD